MDYDDLDPSFDLDLYLGHLERLARQVACENGWEIFEGPDGRSVFLAYPE